MTGKFHNNRSIFWLLGVGLLVIGFLAFAVIVPNATSPGSEGPDVNVPNMQHVPPSHAPHMQLDVQ